MMSALGRVCHCPRTLQIRHRGASVARPISCRRYAGPAHRPRASDFDLAQVSEVMSADMEPERRFAIERLASALDAPLGAVKQMVHKRKAVLSLTPDDVNTRVDTLADVCDVTLEQARRMAVIQPGLLFDTAKQAETLKFGIQAIAFELEAPREEVVELILNHPSILHGRELRLSVADMAHLSLLREPKGRVAE